MLLPCSSDAVVLFSSADTTDKQKIDNMNISNILRFQLTIHQVLDGILYQPDVILITGNVRL
jgi:hypothetical protein